MTKTVAHGTAGGVMQSLQGGKFGHGFVSTAAPELLHPQIGKLPTSPVRILSAVLVGGSVSSATGGKFANGAVTAAFMWAFNHEAHNDNDSVNEDDGLSEHILENPENTMGIAYDLNGNGRNECVEYIQATLSAPSADSWRAGRYVLEIDDLPIGTAIMTADANGNYPNSHPRHAAIFMGFGQDVQDNRTILVIDQWYNSAAGAQVPVGTFGYPRGQTGVRALRQNSSGPNNATLYYTARW
jgi:hypothetical protein